MPKKRKPIFELDNEEQELSDSFDRGEWKSVKNLKKEISIAKQSANNYLREKEKISIWVQTVDMHIIRKMAAERWLRPHTYITSVLH